jgi:hypothetical protein
MGITLENEVGLLTEQNCFRKWNSSQQLEYMTSNYVYKTQKTALKRAHLTIVQIFALIYNPSLF